MVKRVTTKVIEEVETDEPEGKVSVRPRRGLRLGWFVWRAGLLAAGCAVLLYFAPAILVSTGLWKTVLGQFVPPLAGKVDAGSLSLGWLSPVVVKDLVVRDESGEVMAQVASLRSQKTLLSLAQNQNDLGTFEIDTPQTRITLRADGSNLEDLIARFEKEFPPKKPGAASPLPSFSLSLTQGTVELDDQIAGQNWQLTGVQANLDFAATQTARTGKLTALLKRLATKDSPEEPAGEIAADLSWQPSPAAGGKPAGLGAGKLTCELKSLPVEIAEGALRRFAGDLRPAGLLSGTLLYEWKDDLAAQRVEITKLSSPQLSLASPKYLGSDKPAIQLTSASGGIELAGQHLLVDRLQLQTDVAALSASLSGEAPTLDLAGIFTAVQSTKKEDGLEVSGEIDLATLATRLPQTLRLRKDTRITEGLLDFSLKSGLANGERAWEASANTSRIVAETAGRKVTWDQPVVFAATARNTKTGIVIDRLSGQASFATLGGQGTLDAGTITAQADLDKLVAELSRFVDWTGINLAGKLNSEIQWRRGPGTAFTATADAGVQDFQLAAPGLMPWQEKNLQLHVEAGGQADAASIQQITACSLYVLSGGDKLTAQLQKPVTQISTSGSFPVGYKLEGELASWLPRLQSFVPLAGWQVSGSVLAEGSGEFSTSRAAIAPTKVTIGGLSAASQRYFIREREVMLETEGTLDLAQRSFASSNTTFQSSALAFRADDLKASFGKEGTSLSGHVEYRAKLEVLSSWLGAPQYPRTWQLGGDVGGGADAKMENGVVQASLTTEIENLAYATRPAAAAPLGVAVTPAAASSPWQVAWSEPKVSLSGEGSYDPKKDRLELRSARFNSAALSLAAAGAVEQLAGACNTNLQGNIDYDMAGITEKLRPILGPTLKIAGREERKFSLTGPLFAVAAVSADGTPEISALGAPVRTSSGLISSDLTGSAGIGWESAEYFGLVAGRTSIESKLEKGIVSIGPVNLPISEGKLSAAPRIYLNEPGMPLVLEKGPLLENVRISQELCRDWLKFVQPWIADATRAEGKFSLALEQPAQVPLFAPKSAAMQSTLTIHQAQVSPGPLAMQYLGVAQKVRSIIDRKPISAIDPNRVSLIFPEQRVPVVVQNQRVHHQGMIMQFQDMQFITQGSVGMDESVDLLLSIPVQDRWLGEGPTAALKGKTIHIPIRGTVKAIKPDAGVLADLGKQILGGSVKDVFKGMLDRDATKIRDKLFGPKPKP